MHKQAIIRQMQDKIVTVQVNSYCEGHSHNGLFSILLLAVFTNQLTRIVENNI